jgi:hypothetical protein
MPGASGHVIAKPSIRNGGVLYTSGVYARKALCLTPGGLPGAIVMAEGRVIDPDPLGEVSRGQRRRRTQAANTVRMDALGTRPIHRKNRGRKLLA